MPVQIARLELEIGRKYVSSKVVSSSMLLEVCLLKKRAANLETLHSFKHNIPE